MQEQKSGCGCFAGGCAAVLIVLVVILLFVLGIAYSYYKKALDYTGTAAVTIPIHEVKKEKFEELSARMAAFKKDYDAQKPASLELTANDINTFISMAPEFKEAKGKVYVRIEDGFFWVDTSIPLKQVAGFRDRFLNGTASFEVSIMEGKVRLVPQSVVLNGKKLPKDLEANIKKYFEDRFQQELEEDPKTRDALKRIKGVAIEQDRLLIYTGPADADSVVPAPRTAAEKPPAAGPAASAARTFVCTKDIPAYDPKAPAVGIGHFLAGTELEILGPAAAPGMSIVRYRDPSGSVTTVLCKNEDLAP
jgi:hypothetical protein